MSQKILLIAYYFPPRQSVASVRLGGLAKFLPEFGWVPTILTPPLSGPSDPRFRIVQTSYPGDVTARLKKRLLLDPQRGLQEQMGVPVAVRESRAPLLASAVDIIRAVVAYPDEERGWRKFAVEEGMRVIRGGNYSAILSSSSPVTAHLIARDLKLATGLPWVADLRDLWTQNPYYDYPRPRRWLEHGLELRTLRSADALVTVSSPLAAKLRALHRGKCVVSIPNGYDPAEVSMQTQLDAEFSITHTGQLYQGRRDPTPLFRALRKMIDEGQIDPTRVRVRFLGPCPDWLARAISDWGLSQVAELVGQVPRNRALECQRASQLLLLLNWNDPRERGIYTGKLFEYLAARRPILAVGGPTGVVSELLQSTGAGVHVETETDLAAALLSAYGEYSHSGGVSYSGREDELAIHTHREMAQRFAEVLNESVSFAGSFPNSS
jgi:glycosyltransferase involved in cell wall biosynthesis